MKKFLALMVAVLLLVCAGSAFAADTNAPTSGHGGSQEPGGETPGGQTPVVVPVTPVNPNGGDEVNVVDNPTQNDNAPSTGSDASKTVEAAEASGSEDKTITITEVKQETVVVATYSNAESKAAAEVKIEKKVSKEEVKQSTAEAAKKAEVQTTSTELDALVTNAQSSAGSGAEEGAVDTAAFSEALVKATTTGEASATNDTSNADSTAAMAASLLKGEGNTGTTGNVNNDTLTSLKREGESIAETIIRVIAEVVAKVEERVNATAERLASTIAGSSTGETVTIKAAASITIATTTRTVTKDDGTTEEVRSDEAMSTQDAMAALAAQAAQNRSNASSGSAADQASAQAAVDALSTQIPVQTTPPMAVEEPGIYPMNTTHKKDMYKKPLFWNVLKQDNRGGRNRAEGAFFVSAIENDGDAVFLNSAGKEITEVPGEDEWTTDEDGNPLLIIPGYVTTMVYMEPGVVYTPVITTTAAALDTVEGITTTTDNVEASVEETRVVENVTVPVYDVDEYTTSFDAVMEERFVDSGYNTAVGLFIVPGEEGVWSANSAADNSALAQFHLAVVRTLPQIKIAGEQAGSTGKYVIGVRYDIPLNTDTQVVSGDNLLSFYPRGLTKTEDGTTTTQATGEAVFLNADGELLTDQMVRDIAAGRVSAAEEVDDGVVGYNGYIVMTLEKDEENAYKPLIALQMTQITPAETPGGETPGGETPGGETPGDNNQSGNNNEEPGDSDPGSSGGGCDAGFGALALALAAPLFLRRRRS